MNKNVLIGFIAAVIIVVGGAVFYFTNGNTSTDSSSDNKSSNSSTSTLTVVKACDVFTLAEAKKILGESAIAASNTAVAISEDITVDTCSYSNNATSVSEIRAIAVMARSARSSNGVDSNNIAFNTGGAANPNGATSVAGYGEKAFWDPATHQLTVLNDNVWYGIVYGGTNATNNTLGDTKKIANLIFN